MKLNPDKIIVLDFGGQYCHLIARRIRDFGVYAEVVPSDISHTRIVNEKTIRGIILSGGARSVYDKNAPPFDKKVLRSQIPILGICYGHQLIAHLLGGKVITGKAGEYGLTTLNVGRYDNLFTGMGKRLNVWMNHRDVVTALRKNFSVLAKTSISPIAAFVDKRENIFGVQFHPEVSHTEKGERILKNFVFDICRCKPSRSSQSLIEQIVGEAKKTIGNDKAIIGLSGGVDSSTAAMLVSKAIGKNLIAVYIDTGLMRQGETEEVKQMFRGEKLNLKIISAGNEFLGALRGVISPERKRKVIGKLFADIFSRMAQREKATFLVQGTIYSDRIESGITKHSSKIKSHHNVVGSIFG